MSPIKKIKTYHILRILTLLLYIGINVFVLCYSILKITYFTLFERVTTLNMLLLLSITLLVPGVLIFVLFMNKDYFVLNIAKGVIQILLIVMIPIILILGIIIGLRMPSVTTNYTNYGSYDSEVEELFHKQEFNILPRTLPSNISDVKYMYKYEAIFDDRYLNLRISWTYDNEKEFEKAKINMISNNDSVVKMENNDHFFYSIGSSTEENQYFQYGYNDKTKRVSYTINYEWK